MPRRDVPYPGMICSLKERIAEIADALKTKLHTINGVEGDSDGDVQIVSDHPAVIITQDQIQHKIEIGLDNSELPAAYVTSVNGQTGTVNLIGADIRTGVYSSGNSATQDISTARASISGVNQNIGAEATARQNADNALQTNINAVQASIPGAAAAAVAADPTIQNLVAADAQNVKLSGNQNINGIKTVSTEATGTYSSQIANSQKIRNEINTYAVTTTGAQTVSGVKTFTSEINGHFRFDYYIGTGTNRLKWTKICTFPSTMLRFSLNLYSRFGYIALTGSNSDMLTKTHFITAGAQFQFTMVAETDGTYTLWVQFERNYDTYYIRDLHANRYGSELNVTISTDTAVYDAPTPGSSSFNSTEMAQ